jgi:hypothetical protein
MWLVKLVLGNNRPAFVAAMVTACLAWGNLVIFHAGHFGAHSNGSLTKAIGSGLALGLFVMPFFFIAVRRASWHASPWEALATLAAVSLIPLDLMHLKKLGHPALTFLGYLTLVAAAFLGVRAIAKRHTTPL